jgi:hypothetical protein
MRRLGALLGVLLAVSITASCGESVAPQEGPKVEADGYAAADKKASSSANDAAPKGHEKAKSAREVTSSEPAVNEMSVFSRPRTEKDVLPSSLAYLRKSHPCDDWLRSQGRCPGESIADQSRLLLTNLGVDKNRLYAYPTTNGWVCWALGDGGGGCVSHFRMEQPRIAFMGIDPDEEGTGGPGALVGIAPDGVVSADVQVVGVKHAATLASNGVFYELIDGSCTMRAFESLTATAPDGSSGRRAIDWAHGPTMDGEHPANVVPEGCRG